MFINIKDKRSFIIPLLLLSPVFLNYLSNLISKLRSDYILVINYYELISFVLLIFWFLNIGYLVSNSLSLNSKSLGIVIFLMSFFSLDNLFLFISKNYFFHNVFLFTSFLWFIFFIYKKELFFTATLFLLSSFQYWYNDKNIGKFKINENFKGDVEVQWYPMVRNIYESSYFNSLINPYLEGYGQMISYFQALVFKISFNLTDYSYFQSTTRIFFILSVVFFLELNISKYLRVLSSLFFITLITNSEFLKYLFADTLMGEAVVSYIFFVLLFKILSSEELSERNKYLIFFSFGFLFLSKQFISTLSLLVCLFLFFNKKYKKYSLFGLIPFFLNYINYTFLIKGLERDPYLSQIDLKDTLFDLLLLRDLNLNNIGLIIKNIYKDKPFTYLILLLIFVTVYNYFKKNKLSIENKVYFFTILLNFIFIFLLYVSAWRNMELESPIRFILNLLHIKIAFLFQQLEKIET